MVIRGAPVISALPDSTKSGFPIRAGYNALCPLGKQASGLRAVGDDGQVLVVESLLVWDCPSVLTRPVSHGF